MEFLPSSIQRINLFLQLFELVSTSLVFTASILSFTFDSFLLPAVYLAFKAYFKDAIVASEDIDFQEEFKKIYESRGGSSDPQPSSRYDRLLNAVF